MEQLIDIRYGCPLVERIDLTSSNGLTVFGAAYKQVAEIASRCTESGTMYVTSRIEAMQRIVALKN